MASKKYSWAVGLLLFATTSAVAQTGDGTYDWRDSSKIPAKRMPQQNEFLNNQYAFPAKPRDQWELGLDAGSMLIIGSIPSRPGFGGGVSVRKSLGHTFSLRAEYNGSFAYGLDYQPRTGNSIGGIWADAYGNGIVYANYKTATHMLSLDAIATLNNIKFYSDKVKDNWYLLGGYTLLAADVDVNAVPSGGGTYEAGFAAIDPTQSRKNIYSQIKDVIGSGNYNQEAPNGGNRPPVGLLHSYQIRHAIDFGAGFAYKLSAKYNIALEDKIVAPLGDHYLDGVNTGHNDFFNYTDFRININIGKTATHVQPLWWWNPLDYAYNELNAPKHMKIPTPILPDSDGDGVTDQFDKEPNTPAGAPVDTHGVSLDTDGDGVPDYKDKEKITPTICQPVDADGVGKCPDPACCKVVPPAPTCALASLPSITFKGHSITISKDAELLLTDVANQIKNNPTCKVTISGHTAVTKAEQALNQKRVDAVKNYLIEKQGLGSDRINTQYDGGQGDAHTIDLHPTL